MPDCCFSRSILLLLMISLLAACRDEPTPPAVAQENPCAYRTWHTDPLVCEVTPTHLLLDAAALEGRDISVVLYYPGFGADVIFASREAADVHDLSSGFFVGKLDGETGVARPDALALPGYYRLHARLRRSPPLVVGEGVVEPLIVAGRLTDISSVKRVRTTTEIREHCAALPGCTMNYLQGIYPIPTLVLEPGAESSSHE